MWQTSLGDRTLAGAEAELIRDMVGYVHDMVTVGIEIDEPAVTDVPLFNALQPSQQMAVLYEVSRALLLDNEPIPELTAIREATVYVLYREILGLIEIEQDMSHLDDDVDIHLRSEVLAAIAQFQRNMPRYGEEPIEDDEIPDVESTDMEAWERMVESLADRVLWDRDFELEWILADQEPKKANLMKQYLGINDEYFQSIAPDPDSEEFQRMHRALHLLTAHETPF